MTLRVEVEPELLAWAIERSGADSVALHGRFSKLDAWLDRSVKPTLKQVEAFAKAEQTCWKMLMNKMGTGLEYCI